MVECAYVVLLAGYQRRRVSCVDRLDRMAVDDALCDADKRPVTTQQCNNGRCTPNGSDTNVLVIFLYPINTPNKG